jgi:hypothetical protein
MDAKDAKASRQKAARSTARRSRCPPQPTHTEGIMSNQVKRVNVAFNPAPQGKAPEYLEMCARRPYVLTVCDIGEGCGDTYHRMTLEQAKALHTSISMAVAFANEKERRPGVAAEAT